MIAFASKLVRTPAVANSKHGFSASNAGDRRIFFNFSKWVGVMGGSANEGSKRSVKADHSGSF